MKIKKLKIQTHSQNYHIIIGSDLVSKLSRIIKNNSIRFNKCLIILDKNIPKKVIKKIKYSFKKEKFYLHFITANEKNKNYKTTNIILNILLNKNFSRSDCLISVGGGITGDIVGFAASLFKRGIQFINVPTTLLSQVDSSIGGKTGVNTTYGKNLIGTFYQPKLVISDSIFLNSLPRREIICGYGEIFKHSLISSKKFFNYLDKNIFNILNLKSPFLQKAIYESCKIKKLVVEKDEKEKNFRKILNFGHTFAHAYEASLNYSKKLNHGEAVLLGISTAIDFSHKKNFLKDKDYKKINHHIHNSKLPFDLKNFLQKKHLNRILNFMEKDKKNKSKKINLILLKNVGNVILNKEYDRNIIKSFLKRKFN